MLYLVRHGETVWNVEGRIQGEGDSPLTERGLAQARANAGLLSEAKIDRLHASPRGRARRSAEIIAEATGCAPEYDDRLVEASYGVADGLTIDEAKQRFPGWWERREADRWGVALPGAESIADVWARVESFANEYLGGVAADANARVCVVAHNGVNRVLLGVVMGWPHERILDMRQPNDVVWRLDGESMTELRAGGK